MRILYQDSWYRILTERPTFFVLHPGHSWPFPTTINAASAIFNQRKFASQSLIHCKDKDTKKQKEMQHACMKWYEAEESEQLCVCRTKTILLIDLGQLDIEPAAADSRYYLRPEQWPGVRGTPLPPEQWPGQRAIEQCKWSGVSTWSQCTLTSWSVVSVHIGHQSTLGSGTDNNNIHTWEWFMTM